VLVASVGTTIPKVKEIAGRDRCDAIKLVLAFFSTNDTRKAEVSCRVLCAKEFLHDDRKLGIQSDARRCKNYTSLPVNIHAEVIKCRGEKNARCNYAKGTTIDLE
jgi:hypothetical protein